MELLADSGCPDIEKASCKFLADALKAKAELPEAEKEAAQAAEEYEDMRREATASLAVLQKAVDDSLYHPEEMEALRGDLRLLVAAEKEYAGLEGQRKELALIKRTGGGAGKGSGGRRGDSRKRAGKIFPTLRRSSTPWRRPAQHTTACRRK